MAGLLHLVRWLTPSAHQHHRQLQPTTSGNKLVPETLGATALLHKAAEPLWMICLQL